MSLNSWWLEDNGRNHKYDPIPEEPPRHHKKTKKRHAKSNHKHIYEDVCIDAHSYMNIRGVEIPYLYIGSRCTICGRLYDWRSDPNLTAPPEGMPLYEVEAFPELLGMKFLPDDRKVADDD